MDIIKGVIEDARVKVTEADAATFTIATAVYQVYDLAGVSVQAQANATITNNASAEVTLSGIITTTAAGFVINSDYEILFTYTVGTPTQTKKKRLALHIGEETGAAVSGNYISEGDVSNWPAGITDEDKTALIERVEAEVERLTKDIFYEAPFDIFRDGNGRNEMALNLRGRIQSVSAIYLLGVAMTTSTFTHTANSLQRDDSGYADDVYLRWLAKTKTRRGGGLFVEGRSNLEIVGTMGWPEKLPFDTLVGTFRTGETITGGTNTYTAIVKRVTPTALWIAGKTGQYVDDEVLTGGTSEATAAVNSADGAVTDPPHEIKQAAIMLARFDNDPTLYSRYEEGSENIAGSSYNNPRRPLTGIREIDRALNRYVRKIPRIGVV